jgi:hypothetical protein
MIATDLLFAIVFVSIIATDGLDDHALILLPLLVAAFSTCAIRHINYYKEHKKIY